MVAVRSTEGHITIRKTANLNHGRLSVLSALRIEESIVKRTPFRYWRLLVPVALLAATAQCGNDLLSNLNTGPGKLDLSITKSVDKDSAVEGSSVTFTITVTNLGPITADTVIGGDTLPTGLTYASHTSSSGTSYSPTTGLWTIGTLGVSGVRTLSVTATVKAGTGGTTLTNRAAVLAFQVDSNLSNNLASRSVRSLAAPAASKLAFTQQPSALVAGAVMSPAVTVAVQDATGNVVTAASGTVTLALTTPGGATLTGGGPAAVTSGVATFAGLSVNKTGSYTLTPTTTVAGVTTLPASAAFTVSAGAATQLVFTQQPSSVAPGATMSPAVTVTVEDANGNAVTTASGTVTLALTTPGGATLTGGGPVSVASGVATFAGLSIDKVGTYTLTPSTTVAGVSTLPVSAGFTVSTTDEPADPGSGYLWADNFDRYVDKNGTPSVQAMDAQGSGCVSGTPGYQILGPTNPSAFAFFGQMSTANVNTVAEACNIAATHPEYAVVTGRGGSGIALRANVFGGLGEVGVSWLTPNNPRSIGPYSGTLVMQEWFRLSAGAPAGAVGYKWFMMWYKNDPNGSRIEIGIVGAPSARWVPNSGMSDGNSAPYGYQYQGPYWDHTPAGQPQQVNDGTWHRWTVAYLPNSTYNYPNASSRDGFVRVWVDGIKIIDVSAAGVTAGHCSNADLDKIPALQVDHFTIPGTLNDPPSNFTIDIDDLKVWAMP